MYIFEGIEHVNSPKYSHDDKLK